MFARFYRPPAASYFLFGPRGTGKSTWLRERYPEALFVDLIDPENTRFYGAAPERLRHTIAASPGRRPVVIDEVQRVPELLQVVHQLIELDKRLHFVLTGSSARKLRRTGVDLLAGRALLTTMHPFMAAELGAGFSLNRALVQGLIPLVVDAPDPDAVLRSYAALYVREEVQAEGLVRNVGAFSRFLEAVSFSHAAILNLSNLARECQVERKVAEGYGGGAERSAAGVHPAGVHSARPAAHDDPSQDLPGRRRSVPFTAADGAARPARRACRRGSGGTGGPAPARLDRLLEPRRHPELLANPCRQRGGLRPVRRERLYAIEVKSSATLHPRDFSGLRAFTEDYPVATPVLLYRGPRRIQERGVLCLPCEPFLRTLTPARSFSETLASVREA